MAPDFLRLHQLPGESERRVEKQRGTGSTVKWPIGLGGKGNDGMPRSFSVCRVQLVMLNMLTRTEQPGVHQTDLR